VIYRSLVAVQEQFDRGERKVCALIKAGSRVVAQEPSVQLDYFEIVDPETLDPVDDLSRPALVAVAAFVGKARLIDNIVLRPA
jgi:pantothenate synthetase